MADEYEPSNGTRANHLQQPHITSYKSFQYYLKLREKPDLTLEKLLAVFNCWYHSDSKRARASRQLKYLKFESFVKSFTSESDAICQLTAEIRNLANIVHGEDQSDRTDAHYSGPRSRGKTGPYKLRATSVLKMSNPRPCMLSWILQTNTNCKSRKSRAVSGDIQ